MGMVIRFTEKIKIVSLLILPILIWFIDYNSNGGDFTFCLFKNLFGEKCYGCGVLRGISAAFHFDFNRMVDLNIFNIITIPLLITLYLKSILSIFKLNLSVLKTSS
jgi:hypothetical protein